MKNYVIKVLILRKTKNMIDVKETFLCCFVNFLTKGGCQVLLSAFKNEIILDQELAE